MILILFANESASPLKESLAYSLVSHYFSLRWVSLAEYILVLRALFPLLLQMVKCTMVTASTVFIQRWTTTRTMGVVIPYVSSNSFVRRSLSGTVFELRVRVWFQNYLLPLPYYELSL
jgi:hypothetical protein